MQIIIIDNYDSFTYNLYHLIEAELQPEDDIKVFRNDKINISDLECYDKIILSPGPGLPSEAGITCEVIETYKESKCILGVCLGHQAVGEVFGAELQNLEDVMHGKQIDTHIVDSDGVLFRNIPKTFQSGRYHSWVIKKATLPDCFTITAIDDEGHIMAISHNKYDISGVQFHPESIMTRWGSVMLRNWIYG